MEHPEERQPPEVITSDTDNATKIQPKEAPQSKRAKFRRFRAYNTGTWNGPKRENKDVIYHQDNLHRYDSISSSVNLSDYQRKRGRSMMDEIDFRELGCAVDGFIFAICVLVANDDVPDGSRYYPHPEANDDEEFRKLADSLDLSRGKQISLIEKLRPILNFE